MGKVKQLLSGAASFIARKLSEDRTKLCETISDKTARDIGLDQATLARLRHRWPSERIDHDCLKELVSRPPRR